MRALITSGLLLPIFLWAGSASALVAGDLLLTDFDSSTGYLRVVTPNVPSVTTQSSGDHLSHPVAVAIGPQGQIYIADNGTPALVLRYDPATNQQTVVSSGGLLVTPIGIAVGNDGTIYVTDPFISGTGAILAINPVSGQQTTLAGGGNPYGIAVLPSGDLAVSRFSRVDRITTAGAIQWSSPVAQFSPGPLCVDRFGSIYDWGIDVSPTGSGVIRKYDGATGQSQVFKTLSLDSPGGLVCGLDDTLYLTDASDDILVSITPEGTQTTLIYPGALYSAHGIAMYGVRDGVLPARPTSWGSVKSAYLR